MSGETPPNSGDGVHDATPVPGSIQTSEAQLSIASTITVDALSTPMPALPSTPTLNSTHFGMPPSPPSRVMNNVNDELFEEGYDTDGQMGPFL